MSAAPNFSAVLRDIGKQRREDSEREFALLRRWTADVQRAAEWAAVDAKAQTHYASLQIDQVGQLFEADAIVLLAALYRGIAAHNTHIDSRRSALAAIHDAVSEMFGEAKRDAEERGEPEYDDPRDWEPGERA